MEDFTLVDVLLNDGRKFEGTLLPQSSDERIVLKLSDGYNIGIDQKNIKKGPTPKGTLKPSKPEANTVNINSKLPKVLILHTGGTIASKVDYSTGGVTNLLEPDQLLSQYPKIQQIAQVSAEFVANMSSDDFRFSHANVLAAAVRKACKDKKLAGVVITTGTDYMSFMAAALHYALQGVNVPVVLTGSQRSSDRGSSDAPLNLAGAVSYACNGQNGVFVAMHHTSDDTLVAIHQGPHVRKMHTSARAAFQSINSTPIALVEPYSKKPITKLRDAAATKVSKGTYKEDLKVGLVMLHPNFYPEQLDPYKSFDALIILGSGLGHAPINEIDSSTKIHSKIRSQIQKLSKMMPVIMTSHCINGRVNLQVYSAGRALKDMGLLGHQLALPPETLLAKTAWILSLKGDVEKQLYSDMGDLVEVTEENSWSRN